MAILVPDRSTEPLAYSGKHHKMLAYSEENHETWRLLYARMLPRWGRYANHRFLEGIESLRLDADRVPSLEEVNRFLCPLTGFRAEAVGGYVPAFEFFDRLRNREFPTTITIRRRDQMDYLPEPDIFHDVAGHVPMHTDARFADTLVRFGDCASVAAEIARRTGDREKLASVLRAMARFFWFTVEFGLMNEDGELKAYGSGLLSSHGEIEHACGSPGVRREALRLDRVVNQSFEIDRYQPLLFVAEGFDHVYRLVDELCDSMRAGKLDRVAGGDPEIRQEDLESFLYCA